MHSDIQQLITLYVSGEISAEEQVKLDAAIEQDPAIAIELAKAIELWGLLELGNEEFKPSSEKAWEQMELELETSVETLEVDTASERSSLFRKPAVWVAAAAVALLVVSSFFILPNLSGQVEGGTFAADNGSLDIFLPDSTHVWLNKDSKISYTEDFNSDERRVILSGEAFFDVTRNEEKPFVVQTGNSETRVLGTSFNVRAYDDEETIEVSVESGKVKFSSNVNADNESVFLRRNERSVFDKETNELAKELRFEYEQLAWRDNPDRLEKTQAAPVIPKRVEEELVLPPIKVFVPNRDVEEEEEYFTSNYGIKKNFLKQTVIQIKFQNSSAEITYANIEATVHYSTKRGKKSRIFKIDESVLPGDSISVTRRLPDWFVNSKVLSIDVTTTEDL